MLVVSDALVMHSSSGRGIRAFRLLETQNLNLLMESWFAQAGDPLHEGSADSAEVFLHVVI